MVLALAASHLFLSTKYASLGIAFISMVTLISHCISLGIGTLTLNFIIFYLLTFNFILEVKFT